VPRLVFKGTQCKNYHAIVDWITERPRSSFFFDLYHVMKIERPSGRSAAGLVFTPHLVQMTRGVLATIYCRGHATTAQCLEAARYLYADRAFVRVTDKPPQTKWATGSNLSFVSYTADPECNLVIAIGVVDNLGNGAAGRAVQNANLICGLSETAGLDGAPMWP
jgi:N-acetyl-gamma-glutamyl-phosphate reductase